MRETERIEEQARRIFEGEAWHGPALAELVADVTAGEAAARPIPDAHTIWEIVRHAGAWHGGVGRRLAGERVDLSPEEDWPPVTGSDPAAWDEARRVLERGHRRLREAILALGDDRLAEPSPGQTVSLYATLHGDIQHDAYHAGQIALLKKAVRSARGAAR